MGIGIARHSEIGGHYYSCTGRSSRRDKELGLEVLGSWGGWVLTSEAVVTPAEGRQRHLASLSEA